MYVYSYLPVSFEYFEKYAGINVWRVLGDQLVQDNPTIRLKDNIA